MANLATSTYKVATGSRKAMENLWNTLRKLEVNSKNVWLGDLAEAYGIDYAAKGISVRGVIYWAELETDETNGYYLLTFETETAWQGCHDLFWEIDRLLGNPFSISYREIEVGCGIFCIHDEGCFFDEECCVSSNGYPFDECCEDSFDTIQDAISEWCSKMGVEQGERTDREMMELINGYEYEDDNSYFYINPFVFE